MPNRNLQNIKKERQALAQRYLTQQGKEWPSEDQLVVYLGPDAYQCELAIICGKLTHIHPQDWYMKLALEELYRVACYQTDPRIGQLKYKTVNHDFVWRYRHAIRENYNHSHNITDSGFSSLKQIRLFIQAIETAEELAMNAVLG